MERKNPAHILFSGAREQRFKCARRAQFDIDVFGVRQKTQEQVEAFLERKIICATFSRIACGNDYRHGQDRHLAFELIERAAEVVESKLEQVRRLADADGKSEIAGRGDDGHEPWPCCFDRSARCHIISDSGNQGRAMVAPL